MTKQKNIIIMMLAFLMLLPVGSAAQEVVQKLDSLQILIGEQTKLHLKVTAAKGAKVVLPSFKPSQMLIPGIEVVEQSDADTAELDGGRLQISRDYTLTSFDEKVYAVPALQVKVNGKTCQGNPLALKVLTVPVDTVHPNQFYPPKDVQDNPFLWSEWSPLFWLSILVLLLFGVMLWLWQRLRQNKPIVIRMRIVKRVPAHEKALSEINVIKQQHTESQENQKEYYTRLTTTLREYIEQRFGFRAMEMTSGEIIEHLQSAGDQKMIDELKQLFRTADLVKFAKYETFLGEKRQSGQRHQLHRPDEDQRADRRGEGGSRAYRPGSQDAQSAQAHQGFALGWSDCHGSHHRLRDLWRLHAADVGV